jgi:hypothetical protein
MHQAIGPSQLAGLFEKWPVHARRRCLSWVSREWHDLGGALEYLDCGSGGSK